MASGIGLPGLRDKNGYRLKIFLNAFVSEEDMVFLDKAGNKGEWRKIGRLEIWDTKTKKYRTYSPQNLPYRKVHDAILDTTKQGDPILSQDQIRVYPQKLGVLSSGAIERVPIPLTKLAKTELFGGKFSMEPKQMGGGGVDTETASEVLSMYCLAYHIIFRKSITKQTFNSGSDLPREIWPKVEKRCHVPPGKFKFDEKGRKGLVAFAIKPKGLGIGQATWLDCCIAQVDEIMGAGRYDVHISSDSHVFSDKFYGTGSKDTDPYKAYLKSGNTAQNDKWNPADMWVMNRAGLSAMKKFNQIEGASVITLNEFLVRQWEENNIYPISLKKLNPSSAKFVVVNGNEYVERISIDNQRDPVVIEFNDNRSNRDVKINFILETVKLRKGMTAEKAQKNLFGSIGAVVTGSQKGIRIKFKVSTRGMELEFTQTKPKGGKALKHAEAKQGALGYIEYNKLISETSRQGIRKLNTLKKEYDNTDLILDKSNNPFTSHGLRLDKPGSEQQKLAGQYLDKIWTTLNSDSYNKDYLMKNNTYLKDKIISGEIGLSINEISSKKVKQTVIQNLYNACASIGIVSGITPGKDADLLQSVGTGLSKAQNISFLGGIHGKVY